MIRSVETSYKGYKYRSRLEARWAVFFDVADIQFTYEPEGFDLATAVCHHEFESDDTCVCKEITLLWTYERSEQFYLPDFFLHNVRLRFWHQMGLFFETKGVLVDTEDLKPRLLGHITDIPTVISSIIPPYPHGDVIEGIYQLHPYWDNYMTFMKCMVCGEVKIEFAESNYMFCKRCGELSTHEHPVLGQAAHAARFTRFDGK